MSRATPQVITAASASAATVPFIRVDTAGIDVVVECAGHRWAGRSELPRGTFSNSEIETLKADKRLGVELFERPAEPPAEPAGVILSE